MSSPTARGRNFEIRAREDLKRRGYTVRRSLMSRGPWDIRAVGHGETLYVQAKSNGYMPPLEHNRLWETARRDGAIPVLVGKEGRRLLYQRLTGPKEGRARQPLSFMDPGSVFA